jgi:hypothetical protein
MGPYERRSGAVSVEHIISNLLNEPGRFFPALPTRNLGWCAGAFFPPPLRARFQIGLGMTLFVICLLIASRAAFRSAGFSARHKRETHTLRSSLG